MPWHLYLAIKQLFPTGKYMSFYGVVSILGVATGVSVLYVSMCIMNGIQSELRDKLRDMNGDIRIEAGGTISDWKSIIARVEEHPNVVAANPYAMGRVMATYENRPAFPGVWAIDPSQDIQVLPFEEKNYLIQGRIDDLDDESVILSIGVANNLGIGMGGTIEIYSPLIMNKLKNDEVMLPVELTIVGLYQTDWEEADANIILV